MKTTILILLAIFVNSLVYSQNPQDTAKQKIVYVYDYTDTVKVNDLIYKGENNLVKWCSPGWIIRKGQVVNNEKGGRNWVANPITIGALDDKKRPVKPL